MLKQILSFFSSETQVAERLENRIAKFHINWDKWNQRLFWALVVVLFVGFIIYIVAAATVLPFPYEFKGWAGDGFVYNAWMLTQGQNFYLDPLKEVSVTGCYTPGFQILTAPLIRVFGLKMWPGRVVAIAGLLLIWVLMYYIATRLTGKRIYGLISVGFLMATYGAMKSHFDDIHPDSWCIAWGLLSLVMTEAAVKKRFWLIPAALAAALSYFTKQTGLSFAIAAILFLAIHRPLRAVIYTAILGVLLALGHLIGQALTGGMFWYYTIQCAMGQPIEWLMIPLCLYVLTSTFIFGSVVFLYLLFDRPSSLSLTSIYALALPIVFFLYYGVTSIRWGGSPTSSFFPSIVLGSILLASGLSYIRGHLFKTAPKGAFLLLILLLIQNGALLRKRPRTPGEAHYNTAAQIEDIVRNTPGEVLVFYRGSFEFLNDRRFYDNWGAMTCNVNWTDYSRLEGQITSRYFTRILIPKMAIDYWLKDQPLYKMLLENYDQEVVIGHPPWFRTTPMYVFHCKS